MSFFTSNFSSLTMFSFWSSECFAVARIASIPKARDFFTSFAVLGSSSCLLVLESIGALLFNSSLDWFSSWSQHPPSMLDVGKVCEVEVLVGLVVDKELDKGEEKEVEEKDEEPPSKLNSSSGLWLRWTRRWASEGAAGSSGGGSSSPPVTISSLIISPASLDRKSCPPITMPDC